MFGHAIRDRSDGARPRGPSIFPSVRPSECESVRLVYPAWSEYCTTSSARCPTESRYARYYCTRNNDCARN